MTKRCKYDTLSMVMRLDEVEEVFRDKKYTDAEFCRYLGISEGLFYKWMNEHPEFRLAVDRGKNVVNTMVEGAIYKNATGDYYDEEVITYDSEGKVEKKVIYRKYQPPNTTAQIYWSKNRDPNRWKDKVDIDHGGEINSSVRENLVHLSTEELRKLIQKDEEDSCCEDTDE